MRYTTKSVTLGDPEGRIQGVTQLFTYFFTSQERVKLRTSTLACTFSESIRTKCGHQNFGWKETWAYPGAVQTF